MNLGTRTWNKQHRKNTVLLHTNSLRQLNDRKNRGSTFKSESFFYGISTYLSCSWYWQIDHEGKTARDSIHKHLYHPIVPLYILSFLRLWGFGLKIKTKRRSEAKMNTEAHKERRERGRCAGGRPVPINSSRRALCASTIAVRWEDRKLEEDDEASNWKW